MQIEPVNGQSDGSILRQMMVDSWNYYDGWRMVEDNEGGSTDSSQSANLPWLWMVNSDHVAVATTV